MTLSVPVTWSDQHRDACFGPSTTRESSQRRIWFGIAPVVLGFQAERQKPREVGFLLKVTQLTGAVP